ncbi:hypothetical protein BH09GEM1_BH09GEM1_22550 [soil metagenome]
MKRNRLTPAGSWAHEHPRLVSFVGPRDILTKGIETALEDRFSFEYHEDLRELLSLPSTHVARPSLYVINSGALFTSQAPAGRSPSDAHRKVSRDDPDFWVTWITQVEELDRRDPDTPILAAFNEHHDPALIGRAFEAGIDEIIDASVAEVAGLVRTRVRAVLQQAHPQAPDPMWDDWAPARRSPARSRQPWHPVDTGRTAVADRAGTEVSAPEEAEALVETWEEPLSATEAEASLKQVHAMLPSLPTPAQRASSPAGIMEIHAPALRAANGRLDAKRIAARLGVPVSRLAKQVKVTRQALSETPDSSKIQQGLEPLASVVTMLDELLPADAVHAWLESPREQFGGASPRVALLDGRADQVSRLLEMVRDGGWGG